MKHKINRTISKVLPVLSMLMATIVLVACHRSEAGHLSSAERKKVDENLIIMSIRVNNAQLRGATPSTPSVYKPQLQDRMRDNAPAIITSAHIYFTDNKGDVFYSESFSRESDPHFSKLVVPNDPQKHITKTDGGYKFYKEDIEKKFGGVNYDANLKRVFAVLNPNGSSLLKRGQNIKQLRASVPSLKSSDVVYFAEGPLTLVDDVYEKWGVDQEGRITEPNGVQVKVAELEAVTPMNRIQVIPKFFSIRRRLATEADYQRLSISHIPSVKESRYDLYRRELVEKKHPEMNETAVTTAFAAMYDHFDAATIAARPATAGNHYDQNEDGQVTMANGAITNISWNYLFYIDYCGDLGAAFMNRIFYNYWLLFNPAVGIDRKSVTRLYSHTYKSNLDINSNRWVITGSRGEDVVPEISLRYFKEKPAHTDGYQDGLYYGNAADETRPYYHTYLDQANEKVFAFNFFAPDVTTYKGTEDDDLTLLPPRYAAPKIHLMFYGPDEEEVIGDSRLYHPYFVNIVGYDFTKNNGGKSPRIGKSAGNQLITVDFAQYNSGLGWLLFSDDPQVPVSNKPEVGKGGISPDISRSSFNIIPKAIVSDLNVFNLTPQFDGPDGQ